MSDDVELLKRRCARERAARKQAEQLLEEKTREVYHANLNLKEMADRLGEQAESYKAIFDGAAEGIITYGESGEIESMNPSAARIFRFGIDSVANVRDLFSGKQDHESLLFPDRVPELDIELEEEADTEPEGRDPVEINAVRSTGKAFVAEVAISRVDRQGATSFTMLVRDLSRRKKLEARLSQAQKMESIGQLAAGIAHEINTPIQFVGDNVSFLEGAFDDLTNLLELYESLRHSVQSGTADDKILDQIDEQSELADLPFLREELPDAIKQSVEGIERVSSIVRAMKEFSQPAAESKASIDLNRTLDNVITVSANLFRDVAEVVPKLDSALPQVLCLPGQMNQALLNVLTNAAEAIQEKHGNTRAGVVSIETATDGDAIEIRVSDNGPGIPPDIQERVFDPFFTTKEVGKGTGQGLAFVYDVVVDKHDGSIQVQSSDAGTTIIVRLPLTHQPQKEGAPSC